MRYSKSPYRSPLFFVEEAGPALRGVVDYRALNRITKKNNTPIPRCDEMFDRVGRPKFFSKLDLKTDFHQIRMKPSDVEKTAFNTKYGQFEYLVMPMGLCKVDRLSRRVQFLPSKQTDDATDVARAFFHHIFPHHGLPDAIISDRDPKFVSKFWKQPMELCRIRLRMSTARHPQTDGASEVMNGMIENYIRCFCCFQQNDWEKLLPVAEFAYNSSFSEDLGMSPFEVDLGWKPKSPLDLLSSSNCDIASVDDLRKHLKEVLEDA